MKSFAISSFLELRAYSFLWTIALVPLNESDMAHQVNDTLVSPVFDIPLGLDDIFICFWGSAIGNERHWVSFRSR